MAYNTFTWLPDANHTKSIEPKVKSARFGDGYEQRFVAGINNKPDTWKLTFTRDVSEGNAIDAFLNDRGGVEAFLWTNPEGATGKYKCAKWEKGRENGSVVTVTCDFERVYE